MRTSESIVNLAKALLKFHSNLPSIPKNSFNPHYRSNFAGLPDIFGIIDKLLNDSGILIVQSPKDGVDSIGLFTTIIHAESGEFIESEFSMVPVKKDPQGIGSCLTYMRRYAITSILKLNADDDDDGNIASDVSGGNTDNKSYSKPKSVTNVNKKPYAPPKKHALPKSTDADMAYLSSILWGVNSLQELKNKYVELVKTVKDKFSNSEEVLSELEIIKDEIKERYLFLGRAVLAVGSGDEGDT